MNLVKRFLGTPATPQLKGELAAIRGKLYLVRSADSPKGQQELIFGDAELALVKTTSDFNYQLIVRALSGDEDAPEDSLDDEKLFLVDEMLRISYFARNNVTAIAWRDLDGDAGDQFEFLCNADVPPEVLDLFDRTARRAQFGRKYGREAPNDTALEEFDFDEQDPANTSSGAAGAAGIGAAAGAAGAAGAASTTGGADAKESITPKEEPQVHPFTEGKILDKETVALCLFDGATATFVLQNSDVSAVVLDVGSWEYWLEVRTDKGALLGIDINNDINPLFNQENLAFIFNFMTPANIPVTYLLRFADSESLKRFEESFAVALWQFQNKKKWAEAPEVDQDYVLDSFNQLNLIGDDDDDRRDDDAQADYDDDEGDDDARHDVDVETKFGEGHERNSALEVGHVKDRSYVVRGDKMGVFKNDNDMEYYTTINEMRTSDGKVFHPSKVLLHDQDRAMVMQGEDPNQLYRMDIEYGKIVDEWNIGQKVTAYAPTSKFAQSTPEDTLLGLSERSMFRIDPRVHGAKVDIEESKTYKTPMKFSSLATTADGYTAVGSSKGDIRLFNNKVGGIARTHIPSLGDPILGLDVTSDGRWLLATCKTYLLLLETSTAENDGFKKSWARDSKPRPRRLQISPENAAFMYQATGTSINFTIARFNTGPDAKETSIITSTGPYVIIWSLLKVIKNDPSPYLIKRYDSNVAADNFKYGTDKRLIVALDDDVGMLSKSAMRKPTRQTLLPVSSRRSSLRGSPRSSRSNN